MDYSKRITPENITKLEPNQVFVFGSNTVGRHGKGAAKTALKWGAKWGQGDGAMGQTYGIPTKGSNMSKALDIRLIYPYVAAFIVWAKHTPEQTFLVTEIGCGLAGYTPKEIAPLFADAINYSNIHLPKSFWDEILPF